MSRDTALDCLLSLVRWLRRRVSLYLQTRQLEEAIRRYSSPELLSNPAAYGKAAKQHRSLGEVVAKYRSWKSLTEELTGAREMMEQAEDEEMRERLRHREPFRGKISPTDIVRTERDNR